MTKYNCSAICKKCKSKVLHRRGDIYPASEFKKRNCVVNCPKCNMYVPHEILCEPKTEYKQLSERNSPKQIFPTSEKYNNQSNIYNKSYQPINNFQSNASNPYDNIGNDNYEQPISNQNKTPCQNDQPCHNTQPCQDDQPCHNSQPCQDSQPCHNAQPCHNSQPSHNEKPSHSENPRYNWYNEKPSCLEKSNTAYAYLYNIATVDGQIIAGASNPPTSCQNVIFSDAPKMKNITFNGTDALVLKCNGTFEAIYTVTVSSSVSNIVSFKLVQTSSNGSGRTIPGSVFSTSVLPNGITQLVGNVKFCGIYGDSIRLVNNTTNSISLAGSPIPKQISIGAHNYSQANPAALSVSSGQLNIFAGSSIYVAIQSQNQTVLTVTDNQNNVYQRVGKANTQNINPYNWYNVELWSVDNVATALGLIVTATFAADTYAAMEVVEIQNAATISLDKSVDVYGHSSMPIAAIQTSNPDDLGLMAIVIPSTDGLPTLVCNTNIIVDKSPETNPGMILTGANIVQHFGQPGSYLMQANVTPTTNVDWAATIVSIKPASFTSPVCEPIVNASLDLIKLD